MPPPGDPGTPSRSSEPISRVGARGQRSAVVLRRPSAHPAGGGRARPGRHRRRDRAGWVLLVARRPGADRVVGVAGRRQLLQRLLGRDPRHRHRAGGSDAARRLRRGGSRDGAQGGVRLLRAGGSVRADPGRPDLLVAGPGRGGLRRRGLVLHRRAAALRLRRVRRGVRLRVLRAGRRAGHDICSGGPDLADRVRRRDRDRAARLRAADGQQPARRGAPTRRSENARWPCIWATR